MLDDVYALPPGAEFTFNRSYDARTGYRSKSMLTVPLKNRSNEVIGALQLINRKRHPAALLTIPAAVEAQVLPYSEAMIEIISGLAGQAAVAIENSLLYESIERLFEGFVTAAVTAIEQRDPTTSAHSARVATMTVPLAMAVDRSAEGAFADVCFTRDQLKEVRYAALLHDFGKVGVREQVLVKAMKLYPGDLGVIHNRHALIRRTAEADYQRALPAERALDILSTEVERGLLDGELFRLFVEAKVCEPLRMWDARGDA